MPQQIITERDFKEVVWRRVDCNGISFVLALYQTLDELFEQEIKRTGIVLACRKGCATCCHQLITCTEMEMDEVFRFIKGIPRVVRRPLEVRLKRVVKNWRVYYQQNEALLARKPFQPHQDWGDRPCPFLNKDGACDIYPVRIIDCRTLTSLTKCSVDTSGTKRFRFPFQMWANNMLLDEQKIRIGMMAVSPMPHWLLVKGI